MACSRHRLGDADPADLRRRIVESLHRGEVCVLPTETVYGLTVLPSHPDARASVRRIKGRGSEQPLTWHLAEPCDLKALGASVTPAAQRLIERYWPGPLTLVLPATAGETVGVRLPAHDFTRSVIAACGEPLWMTSVNRFGEPPLGDPAVIASTFGDAVHLLVDDGSSPLGVASTVVRATGPAIEVLREGILTAEEILTTAADLVLFVCTGNTCRSPLAEALAYRITATALRCEPAAVRAHGIAFASAGVSTMAGMPASDGSLAAAAEIGLDLARHQSQPVTPELLRRARQIFCLGDSHRRALLAEMPEVADRISLLRPDDLDIADPFGGDLAAYRRARDELDAAITARAPTWLQPLSRL